MKLKLKESIRAGGVQYRPPAVVDTDALGISEGDAEVLVRRGTAVRHVEPVAAGAPVGVSASALPADTVTAAASGAAAAVEAAAEPKKKAGRKKRA
jgi:hypothetical protein